MSQAFMPRCCVDRVVSIRAIDRAVLAVRENPANHPRAFFHSEFRPSPLQAALATDSKWNPGRTLRIAFRGGTLEMRQVVMDAAAEWSQYANVEFEQVGQGDAEVRVSFDPGGSWSLVGTDILTVGPNEPTLNIGWEPDRSVCLHELGHTLGLIHEHQIPAAPIPWDVNKVIAYYAGSPNYWSPQETEQQVLQKYSGPLTNGGWDRQSIMEYPIDPSLVTDPSFAVGWNDDLSAEDRSFIARIYPGRLSPVVAPHPYPSPNPPAANPFVFPTKTTSFGGYMVALLRAFLAWVPGEFSKEVNLSRLTALEVETELATPGVAPGIQVVIDNADTIFPDPFYRSMAVRLLTSGLALYGNMTAPVTTTTTITSTTGPTPNPSAVATAG